MVQIIILAFFTIAFASLTGLSLYEYGWDKREERFQNKPIQYNIGNEASVRVDNVSGAKTLIQVQNKDLVEVRGL